ncbi:MAG: DUF4433 domain-containing protein [Planctomycetes bacterium]|nr:DUF4433 domain-containing protein [Planctomycetota bacterium]
MPTDIFHITHVENLAAIVAEGGLWCDREAADLLAFLARHPMD